jgi:hypothetical protein
MIVLTYGTILPHFGSLGCRVVIALSLKRALVDPTPLLVIWLGHLPNDQSPSRRVRCVTRSLDLR